MLKYWFRYFITIFFSFRTPIGVKEYRLASLFLLITIAILKAIEFVIVPLFNQTEIRSHETYIETPTLFWWNDYTPTMSTNSYTTNNIDGVIPLVITICITAYFILCYRRFLDIKKGIKNFKLSWFFILPLFTIILSRFYGVQLFQVFLIYYLPIFISLSFKEYLSDESTERKEWWGDLLTKFPQIEIISKKINKNLSPLKNKIHYIGYFIALILFLLAQFARYSFRDFLTFMEYFLNPLSIGIFFFYLIDLLRTFYFIDGLDECKESKNLMELNNRITSFTQEIINSDEVSKTINDIKSTTEKSKDIIKQYDSSKLKDISEKVKDTIKKFDD